MFTRHVRGLRRSLTCVLVGCVLACGAAVVRARQQPQQTPDAAQTEARARAMKEMGELFELAIKLEREAKYDEAIPLAERIVAVAEGAFGPEGQPVATALVQLARLYAHKNELRRAEPLNRRALDIAEKTLGRDSQFLSLFLGALASVSAKLGEYDRAASLYERALALEEKEHGPDSPQLIIALITLGDAYRHKADYARAEAALLRAVALAEKAGGDGEVMIAPLDTLVSLYVERGDLDRAAELQRRTLALREKAFGAEHFLFAVGLINAANVYREQGEYVRSEQNLQRALPIFEKALGPEDPKLAALLNNLAGLYESVGELERAEALLVRALAIDEKVFGPEHIEAARDRHALANHYLLRGDHARAQPLFESALALREKILGPEHPEVAITLNGLGMLHSERKDYARAAALMSRSLAIREKAYGLSNRQVGFALNNLGALAHEQGDYERAAAHYERALKIYERTLGPRHPDTATLLNNLAILREATGRPEEALAFASRGNDIREETLALILSTGSERRKLSYTESLSPETNYTVSLHLKALPANTDAARMSLTTVLRRKGRALDATSGQIAALRRRLNPADRELLDKLSDARTRLAALMLNGVGDGDPAAHEASVSKLKAEIERLETEVSDRSAEFRATSQPVTLARVQEAIPASAALVEIVWYRPVDARAQKRAAARYAAYVVRREGPPAWVELGDGAEIDAAASSLRAALSDPRRNDVRSLSRALDERVMRPVRKLVGESRQLFISPDGALNLVPFAALVDERDRYLVESYSITYLTSGRDLLRLRAKVEGKAGPLVVADPSFDAASNQNPPTTQSTTTAQNTTATTDSAATARRSADFADAKFSRLPGTAGEAQALGALMPGVTMLTGARATEAALKRVSGPRVLHVATHGFFLTDQTSLNAQDTRGVKLSKEGATAPAGENMLLRSGLALAGANARRSDGGEDGILTALEAAGLDLWGTKLVVLSACETGLGEVKNGQGVYGLRRALVLAGSESQVMTLWQVSDEATRDLMVAYYKRLQAGEGRTEALRQVQLEMLKGQTATTRDQTRGLSGGGADGAANDRRHPFYWASFIQSGDWQPMNDRPPAVK